MTVSIGKVEFKKKSAVVAAGPCAMDSPSVVDETASFLSGLKSSGKISDIIMKFSYDKANRTSRGSFRGPGIDRGLDMVKKAKEKYKLPVLIDVHCRTHVERAASVADCLQIPAFLCRQTDLIEAAASTGKTLNIKKGQFMSPHSMKFQAEKALEAGAPGVILTERGTFFGYGDLVVDMRSILIMKEAGFPVLFDATHSNQSPACAGSRTGGSRKFVFPLVRCAISAGADGLYCEVHPDPEKAKSDRGTQLSFSEFEELLDEMPQM